MSDDVLLHDVHVAVFGVEVWPLPWPVILGLLVVALVVVATTVALMYRGQDSARHQLCEHQGGADLDKAMPSYLRELAKAIGSIEGLAVREQHGRRQVATAAATSDAFDVLLDVLAHYQSEFALYDPSYPSPSDPGAYFSYSPGQSNWLMTLGNHGWGGGIYELPASTVALQLKSLCAQRALPAIDLDNVNFMRHYGRVSSERNQAMEAQLLALHRTS